MSQIYTKCTKQKVEMVGASGSHGKHSDGQKSMGRAGWGKRK